MTPRISRRHLVAGLALLGAEPAVAQSGTSVTVFAAASLKNALDEVNLAYGAHGGPARASYASSSVIARQIEAGAPADVFISADTDWMDELAKRGLIAAGSRRDLLTNRLVLIAPKDSPVRLKIAPGMDLAAALGGGRLAIGGPDVPAGRYAEAALEALGVWPSVKDHLAPGENVRATLAFVARGEAPLGIVYETDAEIEPAVRVVGVFPASSHPPIVYPAALVATSRNPAASAYLAFLRSPRAGAIFRRYGFGTVDGGRRR
jgi:molybdate transport system substrate-binding protein